MLRQVKLAEFTQHGITIEVFSAFFHWPHSPLTTYWIATYCDKDGFDHVGFLVDGKAFAFHSYDGDNSCNGHIDYDEKNAKSLEILRNYQAKIQAGPCPDYLKNKS